VHLEDTSVMKIRFTIAQTELAKVKVGQHIDIYVDAYPQRPFKGAIAAIEPVVKQLSGVVEVQAAIPNNEGLLRSGMYAKVQILLPVQTQQVVIPQTAVNFTLYGQTVYVVADGKDAKGQPIKTAKQSVVNVAERDTDVAHVVSGLKVGDVVVTSGQIRLSNGSQVKAVEDNTLAKPAVVPAL
jgi:membrane fusion protein (multidrug efflux system)